MTRIALATAAALIALATAMSAQAGFGGIPNTAQLNGQTWNGQTWNGQTWNGAAVATGIISPTLVDIELPRR